MRESNAIKLRKTKARSRVTNGKAILPKRVDGRSLDGRSQYSRRLRDLTALLSEDAGGASNLSQGELMLVKRAATLAAQLELLDFQFALATEPVPAADLTMYTTLSNTLRRLLLAIGLKRRPRDVTVPTDLQAYLRSKRGTRNPATINGTASRVRLVDDADD